MRISRRRFAALVAAAPLAAQPGGEYDERFRPQFHFSPKKGWTNDPNGLVFYKGEYHLFFQHNPFDTKWGNMTWGHAVSKDMVRWRQGENVLLPDRMGTMFSGSAVVDWENTSGFAAGAEKPIVLIYTAAGGTSPESKGEPFTQCIAYSADGGRTFVKYAGNPVLKHIVGGNRDPKVVWHAPTRRWIMALYLEGDTFGFFSSPDLKAWTHLENLSVPGTSECPDFFEMPVDGEAGVSKWVWTAANGHYVVGSFDGRHFTPEVLTQALHAGANYYAVQTFSDLPGGRRVQMSWMRGGEYPGMPFNQQMSVPYELKLRRHGYRSYKLFAMPVAELEALRGEPRALNAVDVKPGENPLAGLAGDTWDIVAEIDPAGAAEVGFRFRGWSVVYNVKAKTLASGTASAALALDGGRLKLRLLVDRSSVEVFGNGGAAVIPMCFVPSQDRALECFASGGAARIDSLRVYPMKSIWHA